MTISLQQGQPVVMATHRDRCEQTLWHVGDDDSDEEDDSIQPVVAEDEGDDEEGDAEEDSHARDDVDEVLNLVGDGSLTHLQATGQVCNSSHHRAVTSRDHHATAGSCKQTQRHSLATAVICARKS